MGSHNEDFQARMKRVKARPARPGTLPPSAPGGRVRAGGDDGGGEQAAIAAILRPQLAFVLGVIAMVAGRAFAMNSLMIKPSTELLGAAEGGIILALLAGIGLLLFRTDMIAQGALVVGAALGFLLEGYFIPALPGLMSEIYSPEYVGLVVLKGG